MSCTIRSLLEDALYLSIADREFSPVEPDGSQINAALNLFVDIIDVYRDQIPFWTEKEINNESELENVGASKINFVEYLLGTVVYGLTALNQQEFSHVATVVGLRAIPSWYWFDEAADAIRVYPLPQTSNNKFIIGFTPLEMVENLDQVIPSSITNFMQLFLKYEVAKNLCNIYNVEWSVLKEKTRLDYWQKLLILSQNKITQPMKPRLKARRYPVPWLAYLSGNVPTGG